MGMRYPGGDFFVETIGQGYLPVQFQDVNRARAYAARETAPETGECMRATVYDCSGGPEGVAIATYSRGHEIK